MFHLLHEYYILPSYKPWKNLFYYSCFHCGLQNITLWSSEPTYSVWSNWCTSDLEATGIGVMSAITESSEEGYAGSPWLRDKPLLPLNFRAMHHSQWVISPCHHFLSQQWYSFFFLVVCSQWDCLYMSSSQGGVDKASLYRYGQKRSSDSLSIRNRSID